MKPLLENLRRWSLTFRSIGSNAHADLLDQAVLTIEEKRVDHALAVELYTWALICERIPDQTTLATNLNAAADWLSWAREKNVTVRQQS